MREIFFQVNRHSSAKNLEVYPHIDITSKALKKWRIEKCFPNPTGSIFHTFLAYITPRNPKYEWVISGLSQDNSVKEIAGSIINYAIPLFDVFVDTDNAVDKLCEQIWGINNGLNSNITHALPLDYVLCFGSKEKAEKLIETAIQKKVCSKMFIQKCYEEFEKQEMKTAKELFGLPQNGFGQEWVKMAFLQGLKIK